MPRRSFGFLIGLLLVLAACAAEGTAEPGSGNPADERTCLAGDPDCQDIPGTTGEPTGPPTGGVSVADVVAYDIDGGFAIEGFFYDDGSGAVLCENLAESFPAQCGGPSIPFDNSAGAELGELDSEQGITWSPSRVMVVGRVLDGVFVSDG